MRLHVSLIKHRDDADNLNSGAAADKKNFLIESDAYWLSNDVIFINDILAKQSGIIDVDRLNGRINIAGNDDVRIYVVYIKNSHPLLVGVLESSDTIVFEIPISDDQNSIARAKQDGFRVNTYEDSFYNDYLDADIISKTYHDGEKLSMNYGGVVCYDKIVGGKYTLSVEINYAEGAEI